MEVGDSRHCKNAYHLAFSRMRTNLLGRILCDLRFMVLIGKQVKKAFLK